MFLSQRYFPRPCTTAFLKPFPIMMHLFHFLPSENKRQLQLVS